MPSLKDLRYRAEYWRLRLIAALVRAVPLDVGVNVSAKAWRLDRALRSSPPARAGQPGHRLPGEDAPGAPGDRARHVGEPRPRHGRDHADRPHHRRSRPHRDRRASNILARYKDKLGAAIGVSLHMGNWELADLAVHARRQQSGRRLPHRQEPLRRPVSARSAPQPLSRRAARQGPHRRRPRRGRRRRA